MGSQLPKRIGKYRILCELGQGGMAVLYLGRAVGPAGFSRLFAIKTIHAQLSREHAFVQMFLDEARLAARIHHPNAVPVYEVGEDDGRHYIAMEYVNGETLSQLMTRVWKQQPPFPLPLALHLVEGVCEALHATHELTDSRGVSLGVVHRDVSPQNIMVGYDGLPRLMDFGVAKASDQLAQTRPGAQKGKVAYMAPEQIRGQELDRRTDIFALGVVLWESIAGRRLFKGQNDFVSAERVREGVVPKLENFRDDVPPSLGPLVRRALSRDMARRPSSARDLGRALRAIAVNHKLLLATPDVAEVMQRVFEDRYAQRSEIIRMAVNDEAVDATALRNVGEVPSLDHVATVSGELAVEPSATNAEVHLTSAEIDVAPSFATSEGTSNGMWLFLLAAGLAAFAALAAVLVSLGTNESVPVRIEVEPPPTAPQEAFESTVSIVFEVTPESAVVTIDGEIVPPTHLREKSSTPVAARISADGYDAAVRTFIPDDDRIMKVELSKTPVRTPPPKRRRRRPKKRSDDRLLLDGDDL